MPDNIKCDSCSHVFTQETALVMTDYEDDMYDRCTSTFVYLTCPKCRADNLSDTDEPTSTGGD